MLMKSLISRKLLTGLIKQPGIFFQTVLNYGWSRGAGFASIRADWLKRAAGLGEELKVAFAGGEAVGRFETLDPTGRLILVRRNGTREIVTAGDIFPAAASSDAAGSAG